MLAALLLAVAMPILRFASQEPLPIGSAFVQAGHRYEIKAYNYSHHLVAVSQDGSDPLLLQFSTWPVCQQSAAAPATAPFMIACGSPSQLSTVNPANQVYDYKGVTIINLILSSGAHTLTPGNCLQLDANDNSVETAAGACGVAVTGGASQSGADPGGGICVSGSTVSLCNPITGTTTFSNATPIALSNTTGPTIITSAVTTGAAFQLKPTGTGTGDLLEVMSNSGASICFQVANNGNVTVSSNCGGVFTAKTVTSNPHYSQNSACSGATPQTGQAACTVTAATSSAVFTFSANYTATQHPVCVAGDETTVTSAPKIAYTGSSGAWSGITVTTAGASDVIDVICFANSGN